MPWNSKTIKFKPFACTAHVHQIHDRKLHVPATAASNAVVHHHHSMRGKARECILQMHDELVLEVREDVVAAAARTTRRVMSAALPLALPPGVVAPGTPSFPTAAAKTTTTTTTSTDKCNL